MASLRLMELREHTQSHSFFKPSVSSSFALLSTAAAVVFGSHCRFQPESCVRRGSFPSTFDADALPVTSINVMGLLLYHVGDYILW